MNKKSNKLQAKDLITIGVFTGIYFAITLVFEVCGGIAPFVWIFMPTFMSLVCGVVYMALTAKVQKFGAVLIMGMVTSLIFSVRGGYFLVLIATMLVAGLLAEWVRKSFGYASMKGTMLSYAVFSLGMVGNLLPVWIFREDFCAQMITRGMPADYVEAMKAITPAWMLVVMIAATFVAAFVGAFIGKAILKKHLVKAGVLE